MEKCCSFIISGTLNSLNLVNRYSNLQENVVSNYRMTMNFFDTLMMQMNNSNISFLLSQTRVKIIYES